MIRKLLIAATLVAASATSVNAADEDGMSASQAYELWNSANASKIRDLSAMIVGSIQTTGALCPPGDSASAPVIRILVEFFDYLGTVQDNEKITTMPIFAAVPVYMDLAGYVDCGWNDANK